MPCSVSAEDTGVEIKISNLNVTPAEASGTQKVHVTFDYQFTLTASGTAYFKEGDIIEVKTNFTDMFVSDSSFAVPVNDKGGNQLGELYYDSSTGTVTFTVDEAAEDMEFHTLTGSFDSFSHFKAVNVDALSEYTVKAGVGTANPAEAEFSIKASDRQLKIESSGKGTLSGTTGTITLKEGEQATVTAVPDDSGDTSNPNQVLSATLVRSDKTRKAYTEGLPSSSQTSFTIKYEDLKPGLNTFVVSFTPSEETGNAEGFYPDERGTSIFKRIYNRDWSTYVSGVPVLYSDGSMGMSANNDIYVNTKGIIQLYGSNGTATNALSGLIVEDTLPGGAVGTLHIGGGAAHLRGNAVLVYR